MTKDYIISIEDFDSDEEDKIRYCPNCDNVGFISVLRSRLYFKVNKDTGLQEVCEPDSDVNEWLQCRHCWSNYKIKETKVESSISDVIEVDNPNSREPSVETLFNRKKGKRKGRLEKVRERKDRHGIKDQDVKKAIKKGERVINYEEYQIE